MQPEATPDHSVRSDAPRPLHRRVLSNFLGFGLLLAGIAMLVLPGPGIVVSAAGLAILAKEYPWAHKLLLRFKAIYHTLMSKLKSRFSKSSKALSPNAAQAPQMSIES